MDQWKLFSQQCSCNSCQSTSAESQHLYLFMHNCYVSKKLFIFLLNFTEEDLGGKRRYVEASASWFIKTDINHMSDLGETAKLNCYFWQRMSIGVQWFWAKQEPNSRDMGINSPTPLLEEVTPFWVTTLTSWNLLLKNFFPVKQKNGNMMLILSDKFYSVCKPHVSAVHQLVKPTTQIKTLPNNSTVAQIQAWLSSATQLQPVLINKDPKKLIQQSTVNTQEWTLGKKSYTEVVSMLATAEVL